MESLLAFLFVLGVVTVVGHGLWLFMAWLGRGGTLKPPPAPPCPGCGKPLSLYDNHCVSCGWPKQVAAGMTLSAEHEAVVRQIERWRQADVISFTTHERLLEALEGDSRPHAAPPKVVAAPTPLAAAPPPQAVPPVIAPVATAPSAPPVQPPALKPAPTLPDPFRDVDVLVQPKPHAAEVKPPAPHVAAKTPAPSKPAEPPPPPPPPRKPFAEVLAAFMEEKHIRWGELAGGLLIIGCSIALVISFWQQIAQFKFFIFTAVTAALFGIGFYTDRQWKLPTTSCGLLMIATLLVPLNFLAIAALSEGAPPAGVFAMGFELAALGLFTWLVHRAGRLLAPQWPGLLTVAVLGSSLLQLLVRRFVAADTGALPLLALGVLTLASYAGPAISMLRRAREWKTVGEVEARALCSLLGISTFAALLPFGLLAYKSGDIRWALQQIAPVIGLAGTPALAIGLLIWQRVTDAKLAHTRTTGTSVGVAGALVMVAATMLAWPNPSGIVPVTLVDFAVLTAVAVAFRIPVAHLLALACLALGYLVGYHAIVGHVGWHIARGSQLMRALFSATTGNALAPMVALLTGAAALLREKGRTEDARHYLQAAAGLAAASLALATVFGFGLRGDPHGAMWVYALYAAAALWLAARPGRASLCWLGSALMLAALAQAMVFKFQVHDAWRTAFLAHAVTATVMACVWRSLAKPMISSAIATAALATLVAWPIPGGIVHATLVDFAVLTAAAILFKAPAAHAIAAPFLVIACVTGYHAIAGRIGWQTADSVQLMNVLLSATTGNVLLPMAALLAAISAILKRTGRNLEATCYGLVTIGVAGVSLLLVTFHGFGRVGDPHGATWVYAIYAATALWMAARTGRAAECWLSSILLLALFAQAFVFRFQLHFGWRLALLAHASTTAALAFAGRSLTQPMGWSALATSSLAAVLIMDGVPLTTAAQSSAHTSWVSAVWLAVAFLRNSPALFTVFQVALSSAVALAATALVEHRAWFVAIRHPWLDPWTLQTEGIALAVLSGAWIALRLGFQQSFAKSLPAEVASRASGLLRPPWPTVDRVVTFTLLVVTVVLATLGAWLGHEHALGAGSWLLLGALVLVLLAGLWERFEPLNVLAIGLAPPIACLLLAGRWHAQYAMTDALRWWLAAYAAIASCLVLFRQQVRPLVQRAGWPDMEDRSVGLASLARQQVLLLGVVPVVAMSLYTTIAWLTGNDLPVPAQESFFGRVGLSVSHAVPLIIISLILGGHALRERSGGCALSAGLALNLAVSAAYLLSLVRGHLSDVEWVRLVQLNAIAFGGVALVWLAASARNRGPSILLSVQSWLAAGSNAFLLAPAALAIFLYPSSARTWVVETSNVSGWAALALALAAIIWQRHALPLSRGVSPNLAGPGLLALATLVTCGVYRWDHGQWLGYHTFLFAHAAAAWAMLAIGVRQRDRLSEFGRWALCLLGLTVVLALRAGQDDPGRPWWSVGAIVAMSALAATLAAQTQRRACLYIAGPLLNLATTIWWLTEHPAGRLGDLLRINVIALTVPGLAWLAMELRVFRRSPSAEAEGGLPAFHRVAVLGSVAAIAALVGAGLWADLAGQPLRADGTLGWLALSATAALVVACLWDGNARFVLPGLYALGLVAIGTMLDQLNLTPRRLLLAVVTNGGFYTLMTSIVWFERERWAALTQRLRMPSHENPVSWLVPANLALAAVVVTLGYWVVLTFPELKLRHFAALAALIQAPAVAVLAHGERRARLQQWALTLGVIGAVAWGWAWLQPGAGGELLHRAVVVMTAVAAMTALYGVGLAKLVPRENEWTAAGRHMVQPLVIVGFGSLAFILVGEVMHQTTSGFVPMAWPAIITVTAALVVACIECIAFAVIPGRDPFGLPERGRIAYVYAAEVLLALVFVHLRLTVPWLFQLHIFRRYWPVILMVIAFAGVGLGEIFKRQNRAVLSEPLERTGAFLPLLPVLGYWLLEPEIHSSVVLLMAAGLYGALSVARQSFGFGVLGAMAANGALWVWLHRIEGCGFLQHPQLWLIPAALSVLIAAYLNRDRLSAEQMTAIRYSATVAIYVASTADIFINGVAQAPWLPLVLAGLSVAGIFAGIALRVRAFLFPGAAFLVLAILTMIWHAAVNLQQTWLWYVSGIVLGVLIIALFAVFEKKRNDILRLVDNLKQWDQ